MSLIQCPECGKDGVSDSAVSCPNCGYNIQMHMQKVHKQEKIQKKDKMNNNKYKSKRNKKLSA